MDRPRSSPAQRKAAERARYRALGRVPLQVWIHPDDRALVRRFADELNARRAPQTAPTDGTFFQGSPGESSKFRRNSGPRAV